MPRTHAPYARVVLHVGWSKVAMQPRAQIGANAEVTTGPLFAMATYLVFHAASSPRPVRIQNGSHTWHAHTRTREHVCAYQNKHTHTHTHTSTRARVHTQSTARALQLLPRAVANLRGGSQLWFMQAQSQPLPCSLHAKGGQHADSRRKGRSDVTVCSHVGTVRVNNLTTVKH